MQNYRRVSTQSSLSDTAVLDIRRESRNGITASQLSNATGLDSKTVRNIINGRTWKHVPEPKRVSGFSNYEVYPDGRIYSRSANKFMTPRTNASGESTVELRANNGSRKTFRIANLVASAFVNSRSRKKNVTYINGNPRDAHFTNISL